MALFSYSWEQRKLSECFEERQERSSIGELISYKELALSYGIFGLVCIVLGIAFIVGFKCNDKQDK